MNVRAKSIRNCVVRIMNGVRSRGDVSEIFSWIRHRHSGNPLVQEIGDLFAHADERSKGLSWQTSRDFYLILNMKLRFEPFRTTLQCEPNDWTSFCEGARAALRSIGPARCKELTGIAYQQAQQRLEAALGKIVDVEGSRLFVRTPLTAKESEALDRITGYIITGPGIDQSELLEQFISSLLANDVLDVREVPLIRDRFEYVVACVIREMHGVTVILGNGISGRLSAAVEPKSPDRLLCVAAAVPAPGARLPGIVFPLFRSSCKAAIWCDQSLQVFPGRWDDLVLDISSGILSAHTEKVTAPPTPGT